MKSRYIYILIFLSILSCTKETTLKTDFKAQTFIFGTLTNESKPLIITIQESVPANATSPKPVNNADISLYSKDNSGNIFIVSDNFKEESGVYTSSQNISPVIGNTYWIEVELQDGTRFKSAEELLKNPVPITGITENNGFTRVSFSDPKNDTNFYSLFTSFNFDENFTIYNQLSNDVLFNGNENAFIETEIFLNNNYSAALGNLNFGTYQFYLNLQEQQEATQGGDEGGDPSQLFAPPPVHLQGNIMNTSTNQTALGNFGVLSISYYGTITTSVFPDEINELIYYTGDPTSNIVIINTQGGPITQLATEQFNDILSTVNTNGLLLVNVHQAQTLNSQPFKETEITFEQAINYDNESTEMLYKVIKYFKDNGKTVYVLGISFGAFMTQELIAKKGYEVADKYLIMVGRLDINEEYWRGFSEGKTGHFENGINPYLTEQTEIIEKNMSKLAAGLGKNRYTSLFENYSDLSNITYVYGTLDEQVGKLTDSELLFMNSKKILLIQGEGLNHSQTIDVLIDIGFEKAFGIK